MIWDNLRWICNVLLLVDRTIKTCFVISVELVIYSNWFPRPVSRPQKNLLQELRPSSQTKKTIVSIFLKCFKKNLEKEVKFRALHINWNCNVLVVDGPWKHLKKDDAIDWSVKVKGQLKSHKLTSINVIRYGHFLLDVHFNLKTQNHEAIL